VTLGRVLRPSVLLLAAGFWVPAVPATADVITIPFEIRVRRACRATRRDPAAPSHQRK
jgi:hypothetical protein